MALNELEVIAPAIPHTRQEFIEAMSLPLEALPDLSEDDRRKVERFGLNSETRRRHAEARRRAQERQEMQGQALAGILPDLLHRLNSSFAVTSLQRVERPDGWFIRMHGEGRKQHMTLEMETVERLLSDAATKEEMTFFTGEVAGLISVAASLRSVGV